MIDQTKLENEQGEKKMRTGLGKFMSRKYKVIAWAVGILALVVVVGVIFNVKSVSHCDGVIQGFGLDGPLFLRTYEGELAMSGVDGGEARTFKFSVPSKKLAMRIKEIKPKQDVRLLYKKKRFVSVFTGKTKNLVYDYEIDAASLSVGDLKISSEAVGKLTPDEIAEFVATQGETVDLKEFAEFVLKKNE